MQINLALERGRKEMGRRENRILKITEHHIVPRARKGIKEPGNVLNLERRKHDAWHFLFGNKDLNEIIFYLRQLQREQDDKLADKRYDLRKRDFFVLPVIREGGLDPYDVLDLLPKKHFEWGILFGDRNIEEALSCLEVVKEMQEQRRKERSRGGISMALFV